MSKLDRHIVICIGFDPYKGKSWIVDSSPGISDSSYWISNSLSVELGEFRISNVSGIPDSLSCIPVSKAQDFNSASKSFHIPDSTSKNCPSFRNPVSLAWGE